MYFSEVAKDHADLAKLDFACTAEPHDAIRSIQLSKEALAFLNGIDHPVVREQARDYFVSRQFRKDLYVRGARRLAWPEKQKRVLNIRIEECYKAPYQTFVRPEYLSSIIDFIERLETRIFLPYGYARTSSLSGYVNKKQHRRMP